VVGQTVVIIGGSAGIGLETARQARAEQAEVILAAWRPDRPRHTAPPTALRSWLRELMPSFA
jgi:NAD(P)-dependent dehydrogenase (short-subunit alcohol dehydrogenase family)